MAMSNLVAVPFDGTHGLVRSGMTRRSDAEVEATADQQTLRLPQPDGMAWVRKRLDEAAAKTKAAQSPLQDRRSSAPNYGE